MVKGHLMRWQLLLKAIMMSEVFLETITKKLSSGMKHKLIMTLQNMIYDVWDSAAVDHYVGTGCGEWALCLHKQITTKQTQPQHRPASCS